MRADDLAVASFLRTGASELMHLDVKILRTLAGVFRPGFLTKEFLDGRRRRYTGPLKLYFVCAAIFFLLAPFAGFTLDQVMAGDSTGEVRRLVEASRAQKQLPPAWYSERFDLRFQTVYTASLFVSVIGGASMLAMLFRSRRLPFGAHVVFELHYVAFVYLATIVLGVMVRQSGVVSLVSTLAVLVPYLSLALRRVYDERGFRLAGKAAAMLVFAFFLDTLVSYAALKLTLWLV